MKLYHYDDDGNYLGVSDARVDPLEQKVAIADARAKHTGKTPFNPDVVPPRRFLMPRNSTTLAPPSTIPDGKRLVLVKNAWALQDVPPPPEPPEPTWDDVRLRRNALLIASDWTQLPDAPLSDAARAAWAKYRQALRDLIPAKGGNPATVKFPISPKSS